MHDKAASTCSAAPVSASPPARSLLSHRRLHHPRRRPQPLPQQSLPRVASTGGRQASQLPWSQRRPILVRQACRLLRSRQDPSRRRLLILLPTWTGGCQRGSLIGCSRWVFLVPLHFQDITPQAMESLQDWWARLRSFLPPPKRKGFDTLFSLIAWELWKERNARVFRNAAAPVPQLVQTIRHFGEQWVLAGAKKLGCLFSE